MRRLYGLLSVRCQPLLQISQATKLQEGFPKASSCGKLKRATCSLIVGASFTATALQLAQDQSGPYFLAPFSKDILMKTRLFEINVCRI